ncbi:ATP-binding protein [Actinophytocola algeriensis]|uniref:Putative ATPase/DNA-binding SARP family transcriptional activator n=1 Tax=Actinophytocola algeriensis TaxID=1768010 RepID=A0A7W7Q7A5_9PSEU|nr:BTAD domain-containing putative transcriptional regulator [Actinophytocola algeriensis]MBB4907946.1 putative ATPase/DNA-binding SARP family transcriptional activator [Actinophytocola algeriensis]MBE1479976.1 putative ATPase/DNA-binding SARP family transcriptional activator [Actinophytocola algeriensis]
MRIGVLGGLEVTGDDGAPVVVAGPRPRALLVLLALNANRVVTADAIIAAQYGDDPPAGAAAAVQAHVSRLRKSVSVHVDIHFDSTGYRLAIDPGGVDALRFEQLAADGRRLLAAGARDKAAALLREATALWRGPALVDLPHGAAQAARLDDLRLCAIEDLVDADPAATSVADLRALVAAHPLRERLRGQLMHALHATGRQAEALAEFEDTRRLLADELGADPSPELAAAHLAILRAEGPPRAGLPGQLTSFVGRGAELARLADLHGTRLVTVLGPGGTGKTCLVIEAARGRDACFVDLSPVTDGELVPHALLRALGLREPAAASDPVRGLVAALDRPLLLVLDNCEQVVVDVAVLVRTLLADCPGLAVLATSREPLGLTGETLLPLAPLGTDAVRLFADRAAAVRPGFAVTDENRDAVTAICAALDGLPLAVELAAARLRQFTVEELAGRLAAHGPFRLLSRGDRTAARRHRTLRAVVEWSWDLLTAGEQLAAARFSVFTGGAALAAVETVCDTTDDVLADLVDRSLVETDGRRYRMLETVRLFCAAQSTEDIRPAHARYYLALAERADPHLRRSEQLERLAELSADHDNLMAALRWSVDGDPATGHRLVAALTAYWWLSGRRSQAGAAATALLDKGATGEQYVACVLLAVPRPEQSHWDRARDVMRGLTELRYPFVAALWGMTTGPWGPVDEAAPLLGTDPWNAALGDLSLAIMSLLDGRPTEGETALRAVLATFRGLGERWGTAQALDWLGEAASWRGEWDRAQALWAESLSLYERFGALEECVDVLCRRADCLARQGDAARAEADLRHARELSARAGQPDPPLVLLGLAAVTGDRGPLSGVAVTPDGPRARLLTALGRHREAVAVAGTAPFAAELAAAVEGLASTAPARDAALLLGTAVALRGTAITGDRSAARTAARATAELGAEEFATAYAEGARQSRTAADSTVSRLSAG